MPYNYYKFKTDKLKKLLFPLLLVLASCSTENNKAVNTPSSDEIKPINYSGCYEMIISRDSALLNIDFDGNMVSGKLEYRRFEKDSNKGTFTGTFNDGIINAWYNFQSEGILSVRQLMFKVEGENILEGYGEMEQIADSAVFKYPQTLKYENRHPYIKIQCN